MRIRISAVLAAALVWGTGAFAADMPVKAPPVVATVFSWTGFYVGGHAGYAWGEANASAADTAALTATYGGVPHPKGFYGGVHGGYNVQLPNRVSSALKSVSTVLVSTASRIRSGSLRSPSSTS